MYKALIVCNSVYDADPASFPELRGPQWDGPHLWQAITQPPSGLFDAVDLVTERSSAAVLERTEAFFAHAAHGDTVLFYFSGHGWTTGSRFYLCARNSRAALLDSTAVPDDSLNRMIDTCRAREKLVLLDCCYGGALAFKGGEPAALERLAGQGRYLLAAAPPTQKAKDAEQERQPSPFTRAVVDGILQGVPDRGDGFADLDGLFSYLDSVLREGPRPYRKWAGSGNVAIARRSRAAPPPPAVVAPPPPAPQPSQDFFEEPATQSSYSPERVRAFRDGLRPDMAAHLPEGITPPELLHRLHLMNNGVLTVAGALLFGESPTAVVPSAMVQCTRIDGTTKSATIARTVHLKGAIPEQITRTRDFIAAHAQIGEVPTAFSAKVEPVFRYPMIAVREIVANALVHRDYEHRSACVHVRVFNDRVEVASPGAWTGRNLASGRTYELNTFASESVRRNFRLADVVSHMRLVEGEGAGIPRAVAECRLVGAPEPAVRMQDGFVVVTIFPIQRSEVPVSVEPPFGKLTGIGWGEARAWSGWANPTDLVWRLLNDSAAPWLLVFDNVADPRQLAGHGAGWLRVPTTAKGVVLVTTRDSDSPFWRDWATVHTVKALAP